MTDLDPRQAFFRRLRFFERRMNKYEGQLKAAIESDPRVNVTRLQVRRTMKSDGFSAKRVKDLLLLFEFICPCGGTRMEMFSIPLKWKQPEEMAKLKTNLAKYTIKHLEDEGLLS